MKRILSIVLTALMLLGMLPLSALTVSADSVTWDLTDGVLTISGTGSMDPLCYSGTSPWYGQRLKVKSIVIEEGITSIGYKAFSECRNVTSVSIPSTVTAIKGGAFELCWYLTELKLPAGLKSIGDFAFTSCSDITELTLPDGLESIGKGVFSSMGITELVIPESVTFIDDYALRYCTKLESVTLPSHMTEFPDQLLAYCDALTTVELPKGLTSLGYQCFYRSNGLKHITIPAGITAIDEYTFYGCSSLEEITFEGTITSVGNGAFESTALTSFPFTDAITEIGYRAFAKSGLTGELVLPDGLTTIADEAFSECAGITSIDFPSALETIEFKAFNYCCGLDGTLNLPSTLKTIGYEAFYCCCGIDGALNIPEGVTSIDYQAFGDCDSLTSVTFPSTVTEYGGAPLAFCDSIEEVILPDNMTTLPDDMFAYLNSLTEIDLPDQLTSLGYSAFFCNEGLTSITIPAGVNTIADHSFYGCVNLREVIAEGTITVIGDGAFSDTWSLTDFEFESGLTYIDDFAFTRSALCGDIVIPEGVTYVGDYAFWASDIESITLPSTMEYVSSYTFWETNLKYINVHERNQHYASVDGVLYTKNMRELIMYNNRSERTEFRIPSTVTTIQDYCFYGGGYDDTLLETIIFPMGIKEFPPYVFYNFSVDNVGVYKGSYAEEYFKEWGIGLFYLNIENLELHTYPFKRDYPIGGRFNTEGMSLRFTDDQGYDGYIDSGFIIGEYDFSTPGEHTVKVGYNDGSKEVWFDIPVTVDPSLVLLPSSDHPYGDDLYEVWEYTDKYNYESLDVTFADETCTEDYYDTITIYDKDGNEIGIYSGTELSGATINVPGNYFKILLKSDSGVNEWGFEVVSVKGNCSHIAGGWTVTKEATAEEAGEEAKLCTKCGEPLETREIPKLIAKAPEIGVFNYDVTITMADEISYIRYALGEYNTAGEIKNADDCVTLNASKIAEYTEGDLATIAMPDGGYYSLWIKMADGSEHILYADLTFMLPEVTADGVMITVSNLYGVKDFFICKGDYNSYAEVKNDYIVLVGSGKIGSKHSYTYTVSEPGIHTVYIRFNDSERASEFHKITLEVTEPTFTADGLQLTVGNLEGVKVIRTAYGDYNTPGEIKRAEGARGFSGKTIGSEYMIQYRNEGPVTVAVVYNNGYEVIYKYNIVKKSPVMMQDGNTVHFSGLDGLNLIRYAKGEYTTSNQIKNAIGCKVIKGKDLTSDSISITLVPGTYTFCVQYLDESYNYYTITVN